MIVISRGLLLSPVAGINLSAPIILWNSLVTTQTVTASSSATDYPADNLATDSTVEYWRAATTSPVTLSVNTSGHEVDAVAFARHNFGSTGATLTVEALVSVEGGEDEWVEIVEPRILANDRPVLFRFAPLLANAVRVTIEGGTAAAQAAVFYAGKLLVMPHGITAGHVPLDQALNTQVVNGQSEAGNFLGRIITGQSASTSAQFNAIPIDWYYAEMAPFVDRGTAGPFFFAWLPFSRQQDVGFAWLNADPRPVMGTRYFDLTLDIGGITR